MRKTPAFNVMQELSDTGNWNTNANFVQLISSSLILCVKYIKIAHFGTEDIEVAVNLPTHLKNMMRVQAIQMLGLELQTLSNITEFAVRKRTRKKDEDRPDDKTLIASTRSDVDLIVRDYLPRVSTRSFDNRLRQDVVIINEEIFNWCLDQFTKIYRNALYPLNRADIIFSEQEELNPEEIKRRMIEDMIETG